MRSGIKDYLRFAASLLLVSSASAPARGQAAPKDSQSLAQLELTAEVAATTDDGYPSVLRITLENVGNAAVDVPVLGLPCLPDHSLTISVIWTSNDRTHGAFGGGGGCGGSHAVALKERVENEWVRLRPGEYMTTSESIRDNIRGFGPGTVEYRVEYTPPKATPQEVEDLLQTGYIIPTEKLHTAGQRFTLR